MEEVSSDKCTVYLTFIDNSMHTFYMEEILIYKIFRWYISWERVLFCYDYFEPITICGFMDGLLGFKLITQDFYSQNVSRVNAVRFIFSWRDVEDED